jgi:hypothetical protein
VTILEWNRLELTSCPPSLRRSRPSLARGWLTRYLRRDYGELSRSFGDRLHKHFSEQTTSARVVQVSCKTLTNIVESRWWRSVLGWRFKTSHRMDKLGIRRSRHRRS